MRCFLFIFVFVVSNFLSAQRLVWLQETISGEVIPNIHPQLTIDPCNPTFNSNYEWSSKYACTDSFFYHLKFHSTRYEGSSYANIEEDKRFRMCLNQVNFIYPYLFSNHEWVNNSDLYSLIKIRYGFSGIGWSNMGNGKWELNSSEYVYICSNDRRGHEETEHQVWQLNNQNQVENVCILNSKGKTVERHDYTYTSFGKIQKCTETNYHIDYYDTTKIDTYQRQQEWFYDDKQRDVMMISYDGATRKFDAKTIAIFKQALNEQIKTGQSSLLDVLDSNQVKTLVIYNYGKFGLEQVNCYYNPDGYSNILNFYSDSLFYNSNGKIIRYVGGKDTQGSYGELWYSYDKASGRLKQITGRSYSECADRGCNEKKILQWFGYDNNKVNSVTENFFEIRYQYKDGKYSDPLETLEEERVYTYKYKTGN